MSFPTAFEIQQAEEKLKLRQDFDLVFNIGKREITLKGRKHEPETWFLKIWGEPYIVYSEWAEKNCGSGYGCSASEMENNIEQTLMSMFPKLKEPEQLSLF